MVIHYPLSIIHWVWGIGHEERELGVGSRESLVVVDIPEKSEFGSR